MVGIVSIIPSTNTVVLCLPSKFFYSVKSWLSYTLITNRLSVLYDVSFLYLNAIGVSCFRNKKGKIVKPAPFQTSAVSGDVARVAPNRKWFG